MSNPDEAGVPDMGEKSVMVCIPTLRGLLPPMEESLWANLLELMVGGWRVMRNIRWGDGSISRVRNRQVGEFLESGARWYVQWSDDVEVVDRCGLGRLLGHGVDFVGGLYPKSMAMPAGERRTSMRAVGGATERGDLIEMQWLSGGLWCVRRDVVEAVGEPWFRDAFEESGKHLTEDYQFCDRARAKGYSVWGDRGLRVRHWGYLPFEFGDGEEKA